MYDYINYIPHWFKTGLKVYHYPICCVLFFCFFPHSKLYSKYAMKYNRDGYVPCPLCMIKMRD